MDSLNTILNSGTYGDSVSRHNDNYTKIQQSLTGLENVAFNPLTIRKTYMTFTEAEADTNPIGDDGLAIKIGQIVSVTSANKIYKLKTLTSGVPTWENVGTIGDLTTKADHGYSSSPKTLKQVEDKSATATEFSIISKEGWGNLINNKAVASSGVLGTYAGARSIYRLPAKEGDVITIFNLNSTYQRYAIFVDASDVVVGNTTFTPNGMPISFIAPANSDTFKCTIKHQSDTNPIADNVAIAINADIYRLNNLKVQEPTLIKSLVNIANPKKRIYNIMYVGNIGIRTYDQVNTAGWTVQEIDVSSLTTGTKITIGNFSINFNATYYAFTDRPWNDTTAATVIEFSSSSTPIPLTITKPAGANYLYVNVGRAISDDFSRVMANVGETLLPYEPYEVISGFGGKPLAGLKSDPSADVEFKSLKVQTLIADVLQFENPPVWDEITTPSPVAIGQTYTFINANGQGELRYRMI